MVNSDRWQLLPYWKSYVAVLIPIVLLPLAVVCQTPEARCGYVILLMAFYWMTEAVPLAVTALIPLFGFPLLGVLSTSELCLVYMKETNMMFLGGLTVAISVEHSNLHRRIALFVLLNIGQSPRLLMAGFMMTTMFLSMWISNTASTAMMVPIVEAILVELYSNKPKKTDDVTILEKTEPTSKMEEFKEISNVDTKVDQIELSGNDRRSLSIHDEPEVESQRRVPANEDKDLNLTEVGYSMRNALMLAVAYSANIGGTGVVTGTSPNLIMVAVLDSSFTEPTGLNFATWMAFNVPGMVICVFIAFFWLQFYFMRSKGGIGSSTKEQEMKVKRTLQEKYDELGPVTFHESVVMTLFISLVLLWFFRSPEFIPGWASWFENAYGPIEVADATPVMLIILLMFIIPKDLNYWCFRDPNDPNPVVSSEGCLTWDIVQRKVPWGIVLLLGGGFAMAEASDKSGLSFWLGEQLKALDVLPVALTVFLICLMTAMVTEVASNTATASILMPVLKEMALGIKVNPIYLMLPSAICCSYAFMLPVATPPNAIVFAASKMRTVEMMKAGITMNLICIVVINIMINTLGIALFDVRNYPDWANSTVV